MDATGTPWSIAVALAAVALVVLLLWRYRRLERAGTPLPPGAGGARMVGTVGEVVVDHLPGEWRGTVRVLGDDWTVADEVTAPLAQGDRVVVQRVTGTRLVVARTDDEDRSQG